MNPEKPDEWEWGPDAIFSQALLTNLAVRWQRIADRCQSRGLELSANRARGLVRKIQEVIAQIG
jgi:hypothetical protein